MAPLRSRLRPGGRSVQAKPIFSFYTGLSSRLHGEFTRAFYPWTSKVAQWAAVLSALLGGSETYERSDCSSGSRDDAERRFRILSGEERDSVYRRRRRNIEPER